MKDLFEQYYNKLEEAAIDAQGKYTIHPGDPVVNTQGNGLFYPTSLSLSKIKGKDGVEKLCEVRHYIDGISRNKQAFLNVIRPASEQTIYILPQYNQGSYFSGKLKSKYTDPQAFKQDLEKVYREWLKENNNTTPEDIIFKQGLSSTIIGQPTKASIQRLRDLIDSMK